MTQPPAGWGRQPQQPPQYGRPEQYGQPQAPQPQYGQPPQHVQPQHPQHPQQAGQGIAVTTKFIPLSWIYFLTKPKIFIDGHQCPPAAWGRALYPVAPGQHHVHVHTPYMLPPQVGKADTVVNVSPGQFVELEYRAPAWSFSPGSLGVGPQKYNGVGITIAVIVVPLVIFLLFFVIMLASI